MSEKARKEALESYSRFILKDPLEGEATEAYKLRDEVAYQISQLPMGFSRPIKVLCVGAGFSGLALAHEVETGQLQNVDLIVYEKNAAIGGTWFENRYPGCACDIPIHNYQYSWAPYPHFPSYYAKGPDIHKYLEAVADQHKLRKYIKVCHKVVGAKWDEDKKKWLVEVVRTDGRQLMVSNRKDREGEVGQPVIEECDVLINGTGCFNDWKWPDIPNREQFSGTMVHSAAWPDEGLSLKGQTVALIGNGSTGVQILPAILNDVKKVYVFIRSPTWVTASFAQKFAGPNGENVFFSEEQRKRWEEHPEEYLAYRKEVEAELNGRFKLYLKQSKEQSEAFNYSISQMKEKLSGKPELQKDLIPDFPVGCRRTTPGNGYLEALCSPKVEVIWDGVASFNPNGLKSSKGVQIDVDTIICATGFNMSFSPRFPIIGRRNVNLQDKWDKSPECYLSVTAAEMPNYFIYLGPASPIGHGSVVTSIEQVTSYISKFLNKMQTQNYCSVVPKSHIPGAYQNQAIAWLAKTAWNAKCASTYKNGKVDGPLISLHPGSRLHYFKLLSMPRWEDFEWESFCGAEDLAFAWLGNGFICEEVSNDEKSDLTWFLGPTSKIKAIEKIP